MEFTILGLIILALDIYAILQVWGSGSGTGAKVLWTLAIVFLPVLGLIIWAFVGPRSRRALTH